MKQAAKQQTSWGTALAATAYQWRRRVATVLAIALAALLAYHVMFGANGITIYQQKKSEDRTLKQQIQELQDENARLQDHIDNLKNDPDTVEHEARTILHYTRPGEVVYQLDDKTGNGSGGSN